MLLMLLVWMIQVPDMSDDSPDDLVMALLIAGVEMDGRSEINCFCTT